MTRPALRISARSAQAQTCSTHLATLLTAMFLALGVIGGLAGPAWAQSSLLLSDADGSTPRTVNIGLGKSVVVRLPRDAKEVFVATPAIANAVVRSTREVYIIAMQVGQTTVYFSDTTGAQIGMLQVNVQRDISPIAQAIQAAIPDSQVVVQQLNDGVMLTGSVPSADKAAQAVSIAGRALGDDTKVANSLSIRGSDQVMLKVTVAEVQRQVIKQLGIDLTGTQSHLGFFGDNPFSVNGGSVSDNLITFGKISSGNYAQMQAFERTGVLKTLAEPTLTAVSGESATFLAGGKVPVPASGSCSPTTNGVPICTTTYTYQNIGVSLNFIPVVIDQGKISLRVATEVTDIDNTNSVVGTNVTLPAFKTRRAQTTVELPSGGSLVMAGMIQQQTRQAVNGTPALMNIPILGQLFRSRDYQRNETELMIMVTPYLARAVDRKDVSLPTDGFADASDPSAWLLGRFNRIYGAHGSTPPNGNLAGRFGFIID